jgi:hypothetical protein
METKRLIDIGDVFAEAPYPVTVYLAGVSRLRALASLTHLLGYLAFVPNDKRGFGDEMMQFFGAKNEAVAQQIYDRIEQLADTEKITPAILNTKALLELVELVWERPDEANTQSQPAFGLNLFKACLAMNAAYVKAQAIATAEAPKVMAHESLASLALAATFADAELNNHRLYPMLVAQMIKTVRLFEFLERDPKYKPLLQAFLAHFECRTWQRYGHQVFNVMNAIIHAKEATHVPLRVKRDAERAGSIDFLSKFALPAGEPLIREDFVSLRTYPLYRAADDMFVMISPVLAAEMLHKGLYFRFELLNRKLPASERIKDWRAVYCDFFSEQYLLTPTLDTIFGAREVHLSGTAIKQLTPLPGEPDYYVRHGNRVVLFESKDVLVAKEIRAEQDYLRYVQALHKKFYYDEKPNGQREPKAVVQLLTNIERLYSYKLPFDTAYDPKQIIVHPVLVVHDRLYNQAGLNVLVNDWFQAEKREQEQQGKTFPEVRPLVVVDVDTLILYQDHFRNGALVWEDVLEAYYRHTTRPLAGAVSETDARSRFMERVEPFSHFLENYAAHRQLAPVPDAVLKGLFDSLGKPGDEAA